MTPDQTEIVELRAENARLKLELAAAESDLEKSKDYECELRGSRDEWEACAKHYVAEVERLSQGYFNEGVKAASLQAEVERLTCDRDQIRDEMVRVIADNHKLRELYTEAQNRQGVAEMRVDKLREALEKIGEVNDSTTIHYSSMIDDLIRAALQGD